MDARAGVEKAYASVDRLRIAYESAGSGGPAVILIHGAFEDRTYYVAVTNHLSERHRVIALDLRGHGESDCPEQVSVEDFEGDVIAVAEQAGVRGAVLCGHSMAGAVALAVAAARPELVGAVVMLDGVVLFPESVSRQAADTLLPALRSDHWLEALRGYFGRTFDPKDPPSVRERVMADLGHARPEIARTLFTSLFGPEFNDRQRRQEEALERFHCPVLYMHAKVPADLKRLSDLRPDAIIEQLDGTGHYAMLSVPEQVNASLDRLLASLPGADRS